MATINFELQPTLTGNIIFLCPLKQKDFDELYKCASDPLIWEQHPQSNRYEKHIFQQYFDGAIKSGGAFAICNKMTNKIIGSSRYYNLQESQVTVGYTFLAREFWGGECNRELKKLMLDHAFKFVEKVLFEIGEKNVRSIKAIEKIGAKFMGRQHLDGKSHVIYEIIKS